MLWLCLSVFFFSVVLKKNLNREMRTENQGFRKNEAVSNVFDT